MMRGGGAGHAPRAAGTAVFLATAAILALAFYREFVLDGARMLFGTDMLDQAFQLRQFAVEEIRAGRGLPLWNPFVYGGLPYLAVLPGPLFYPSSLLYLLLPLPRAIGWTFVLHTFLAGAFAYFAARSFRLERPAAVVTGLAFMFGGYLTSTLYGGHDGRMFGIVLIPLAFGCLERALRGDGAGWYLGVAGTVALQILTPHVQVMYFSSLGLCLYAAFRLATDRERRGRAREGWLRPAALLGGAFGLAAVLGAVQLVPTFALLEHAVRGAGEGGYDFASSWALPPQELTALLLPDLVGSLDSYWGRNPFKLHTEYLGAVTLALAALAVAAALAGGRRRERSTVAFLAGASLLGVLFALGSATPVHRVAYHLVPMIDSFRAPSMMLGPVSFFVALLAGFGWQRAAAAPSAGLAEAAGGGEGVVPWAWVGLLSLPAAGLGVAALLAPGGLLEFAYTAWFPVGWPRRPPQDLEGPLRAGGAALLVGWGGALALAAAAAGGRLRPAWAVAAVAALLVADLWRVDVRYLRTVETERALAPDEGIEFLRESLEAGGRVWPLGDAYGPNELMQFGVPAVTGSQNFRLRWYDALVGGVGYDNLAAHQVLWPLFDIRYVASGRPLAVPAFRPAFERRGVHLYEVSWTAPHAFFPRRLEVVEGSEEAIRRTLDLLEPLEAAFVEVPEGTPPPHAGGGSAEVVRWTPDEVVLDVQARVPGLLFVSEVWHPGWRAEVDGDVTPVYRVNGAFRGVQVPLGRHEVRLVFRSGAARAGAGVSAAGLLLWLGGLVGCGLRARRRRGAEGTAPGGDGA